MQGDDLNALLDLLRSSQAPTSAPAPRSAADAATLLASLSATPTPSVPSQATLDSLLSSLTSQRKDPATLSFPESLPILQNLGNDSHFVEALAVLKAEQGDLELAMKDERNRLEALGKRGGISPVVQAQKLKEWDRNALVVWKGLQDKQRGRLQQMGVPTMSLSVDTSVIKRQERVMGVLVGFLDDS